MLHPTCRLAYWQQQPCVSHAELQCLREGAQYTPEQPSPAAAPAAGGAAAAAAAAAAAQQQVAPAVEAALQEDGTVAVSSSPQLQHPLTGEPLQLALPLDRAATFSTDRLLLQAAAHSAATQLAAVQAVLQRAGRLEAAGVHTEIALTGSLAAPAADAQLATSPSLHLWHAGGLQLSLSVQLRTGRLLLAAAPALLESEQGPAAAAAAEAAQQQLDKLQRDAMAQPLPQGCSRGMLAVQLMAEALARVSLQLSLQRRMDAAASAAAAHGLRRAMLPPQLLQQHLQRVALLVAPLSLNLLTLALPTHPPPTDLAQWARERQQRSQQQGGGGGVGDSGATRCFVLLDFGESAAAAAGEQQQQAESARQPVLRVLLAVCACTSRGTVTRVLQLTELPPEVMREMQREAAGQPAAPAGAASRKRRASDAAADADGSAGTAAAAPGGEAELGLAAAVAWCKRQAGWAALHAQLQLLPAQHAAECSLTAPLRQRVRLPKLPSLAPLDAWAAARLALDGSEELPVPKPAALLELEEVQAQAQAGAWRVDLSSRYFARLRPLLQQLGVGLAPPAPDAQHMAVSEAGLALRYSLQQGGLGWMVVRAAAACSVLLAHGCCCPSQLLPPLRVCLAPRCSAGHSVLTAVTDLSRLGLVHTCLARLASAMAANPLAAAALGSTGIGGSNGWLDGPAANPANGALPPSNGGAAAHGGLVWPLPGCGSVRLLEAGLTHLVLLVSPPPLPEGQEAGQGQQQPVRVTVSWVSSHAAQKQPQQQQQQPPRQQAKGKSDSSGGSDAALRLSHCCVTAEPPLLEPVSAALEQQLEAGRVDLFLDSLCLAAHSAAAAAQQLAPDAQRAASLLPGALQLAPAGAGGSSALRVRAQVQQGGRGAALVLGFHAAGYALLQVHPTPGCSAAAAAWLPQLWQQLQQHLAPSFAPVDAGSAAAAPSASTAAADDQQAPTAAAKKEPQLLQAWVHRHSLAEALRALLQAVAAPGS